MNRWSQKSEEELTLLIKEWLKHHNRTQADLSRCLKASSTRMSAIIESLRNDYSNGGMRKITNKLCSIEETWLLDSGASEPIRDDKTPFDQLDLILEELKDNLNT